MKDNVYTELVKKFREERGATALSDADMEKVSGGVGGANEATCPSCGKTMRANSGFGDTIWYCEKCDMYQIVSDAEFIEMVKIMEQLGYPVQYPVWWDKVK